jgi:glycosyltransferase involved in cell wall biosynthesis
VLPITNNFGLPSAEPRAVDEGHPTVLALAGAFNPWFDDITLVKALDVALKKRPDLQVICTGGGIEGFYESGFNRFSTWAKDWADRVTIHGWLPHGELSSVLHTAHAGLSLDVTGSEPELGSRTRLLLFAQMGITPVSTVNCELAQRMQQAQALVPLSVGDVGGIAETLCGLRIDTELSSRAQSFCAEQFDVERVMAPLCRWVSSPHRTQSAMVPEATIAAELASHRDQLAQIYASPTWQVLDRVRALSSAATNRFRAR